MNTYESQANEFLNKTKTTITARKLGCYPYFDDNEKPRDVYQVTIARGDKIYTFKFGQSLAKSDSKENQIKYNQLCDKYGAFHKQTRAFKATLGVPPTAYDILATITKSPPGTFKEFCSDFGYSTDSIKASKIYFAVQEEYENIYRLFHDVMTELNEIQ